MAATFLKERYGSSAAMTITLGSLANDSTNLLAGRQSTVVDNTTNLWLDYLIAGFIKAGTSPTVNTTIEVWAFATADDTPTYPDVLGAADAAVTLTSANVKNTALRPVAFITVDATSNRIYPIAPISLANIFGYVPKYWGIVVINGSGVALNASGSSISYTPVGMQLDTV